MDGDLAGETHAARDVAPGDPSRLDRKRRPSTLAHEHAALPAGAATAARGRQMDARIGKAPQQLEIGGDNDFAAIVHRDGRRATYDHHRAHRKHRGHGQHHDGGEQGDCEDGVDHDDFLPLPEPKSGEAQEAERHQARHHE